MADVRVREKDAGQDRPRSNRRDFVDHPELLAEIGRRIDEPPLTAHWIDDRKRRDMPPASWLAPCDLAVGAVASRLRISPILRDAEDHDIRIAARRPWRRDRATEREQNG